MANDIIPPPVSNGGGGTVSAGTVRAPDYRQVQAPAQPIEPWALGRDAVGIGDEAAALGRTFREFEDVSSSIGEKLAGQAGAQAGAAAGAAGNGKPLTGLQAITAYGQNYDAAVHQTYYTKSQLALEQQLTEIESNNSGNPNAFQTQAGKAVQGALDKMDPSYRPDISLWAQARIQAGVSRQRDQAVNNARNESLATYQSATPDLITSALHTAAALPAQQGDAVIAKLVSDDQDRLNALVASHVITPEQAVTLHQKMVANATMQMDGQKVDISLRPVLQTMRSNVEAADQLITQPDPALTPAQNAARIAEYDKEREQWEQLQTHAHAEDLAGVHQQLAGGAFGENVEGTLHQLYKAGALSQEGLYSGLAESLRNQKKRIGDEADMTLVDQVVHGDPGHPGPLDPQNKAQAAAVDKYFQEHVAQSGAVSGDQFAAGAAEITRQTGILPASVASHIRVGLLSGDPNAVASAAALASRIESVNPRVDVFSKTPRLAALARMVNDNITAGLPATQAVNMALAHLDPPPEQRKIRDAKYAQELKAQGPNGQALQKALDHEASNVLGFGHSPPAPIAMQADYNGMVRQFYDSTGNLAQARQLAETQLHKTWGVSTVNGSQELMKYPIPDNIVPTVRADVASSVKAAGYGLDPSQVHLAPNAYTDQSGGKIWSLVHTEPNGLTDVLLDKNNRPLTYRLPSGPDFVAAREKIVQRQLIQARQLRDAQRENSSDQVKFEKQLSDEMLRGTHVQGRNW